MIKLYISSVGTDFKVIYMLLPTNEVLVAHDDGEITKSYFLDASDLVYHSSSRFALLQYIGSL